jgi:hypothetical protein
VSEPTPPVSGGASDKGEALVAEYRKKIADTEDSAASLPFLARWEQEVKLRIPRLAGEEAAAALLEQIAAKRAPIRVATVDGFKRAIDVAAERLASDRMAVIRIEEKVETASKVDLAPEQFAEIESHARMRQEPRANRALAAGEQALEEFPESLKGLDGLQKDFQEMRRVVVDRGSEVARSSYLEGTRLRLTEIAREALPEFRQFVEGLPDEPLSITTIKLTAIGKEGFEEVDADVRAAYDAVITAKRQRIMKAHRR